MKMDIPNLVKIASVTIVDLSLLPEIIHIPENRGLSNQQFINIVKSLGKNKEDSIPALTFIRFVLGTNLDEARAILNEIKGKE